LTCARSELIPIGDPGPQGEAARVRSAGATGSCPSAPTCARS